MQTKFITVGSSCDLPGLKRSSWLHHSFEKFIFICCYFVLFINYQHVPAWMVLARAGWSVKGDKECSNIEGLRQTSRQPLLSIVRKRFLVHWNGQFILFLPLLWKQKMHFILNCMKDMFKGRIVAAYSSDGSLSVEKLQGKRFGLGLSWSKRKSLKNSPVIYILLGRSRVDSGPVFAHWKVQSRNLFRTRSNKFSDNFGSL